MIGCGRSAFVTFSYNLATQREKVKFTLSDDVEQVEQQRPVVMAALTALHATLETCVVTDKGHKSKSDRRTVVEFWVSQAAVGGKSSESQTHVAYPPSVAKADGVHGDGPNDGTCIGGGSTGMMHGVDGVENVVEDHDGLDTSIGLEKPLVTVSDHLAGLSVKLESFRDALTVARTLEAQRSVASVQDMAV